MKFRYRSTIQILYFFVLFSLEFSAIIGSESYVVSTSEVDMSPLTILALGDSYTIGQGVSSNESWPVQLTTKLESNGYNMEELCIIAQTGWRTYDLLDAIDTANINHTYDIVTLLIGVNDQYSGRTLIDYTQDFSKLFYTALSLAGNATNHLLIISIPDYSVTPFVSANFKARTAQKINEFNVVNTNFAEKYGSAFINVTGISRLASNNASLLAPDKLHPSGLMYNLWVDLIFPEVQVAIQNPPIFYEGSYSSSSDSTSSLNQTLSVFPLGIFITIILLGVSLQMYLTMKKRGKSMGCFYHFFHFLR